MADHKILVDIWTFLRNKRNVIVLLDTENDFDISMLLNWFKPITKGKLSSEDIILKNGTFLCVRKLLARMPTMDKRIIGDYEIVVINNQILEEIRQELQNE